MKINYLQRIQGSPTLFLTLTIYTEKSNTMEGVFIMCENKECSKCKKEKPATAEYFGRWKDGFQSWCKECKRLDYIVNKEKRDKRSMQRYYELNPKEYIEEGMKKCCGCKEIKPATSEYFHRLKKSKDGFKYSCIKCRHLEYESDSERIIEKGNRYYQENKEQVTLITKKYKATRIDWYREYHKEYYNKNQDKIKESVKTNFYKRLENDIGFKLLQRARTRIYQALKSQGSHKSKRTKDLIGCTVPELKVHLESKFVEGMSWENYGKWHVDHIRPCANFDFTDENQQQECFNYTNLQPLWAEDNMRKSAKYEASLL